MGYSDRVELRFSEPKLVKLDAFAAMQGMSRSEAIRTLIDLGLSVAGDEVPKLSAGDKLMFEMLRAIVSKVGAKSDLNVDFIHQAIVQGQNWAIPMGAPQRFFTSTVVPADLASFVRRVMEMWVEIDEFMSALSEKDQHYFEVEYDEQPLKFVGFKREAEAQFDSAARFLSQHEIRFKRLQNSFRAEKEMADTYEQMLSLFESMQLRENQHWRDAKPRLTREQVVQLFNIAYR
jgi:uncharacterized protein YfbU (UPF0304 family)